MSSVIPAYRFSISLLPRSGNGAKTLAELTGLLDNSIRAQEVSGLGVRLRLPDAASTACDTQGQLQKGLEFDNLTISRALVTGDRDVAQKFLKVLNQNTQIERFDMAIYLLDQDGSFLKSWLVIDAYITQWQVEGFSADARGVLIEKLTFEYKQLREI
ncbi:hypothetical protein PRUB_a0082 [Pseudoalteromonas rubra]|uniref:Phage tail protein n=1 Tax=Pseudoalteromonas rubra TaxID=43658 RepID=A0A8T0C4M8_9GAMM|nr:phage tail protein [Pseudoalteromonas rubra]KAF7785717.1 hypothetical protein PRUB_a0082 [Pseudoalteromonas rubra]